MVVIYKGNGNHSNRLLQALHIEAFCIENGINFKNISFHSMCKLYGIKSCCLNPVVSIIVSILNKLYLLPLQKFENAENNEFYKAEMRKRKLLFVEGWCFRVPELVTKYHDYFVHKYSLKYKLYKDNFLYNYINKLNRTNTTLVGVHIRKGDYKEWQNGKYYFNNSVYEESISKLESQIWKGNRNQKVVFIIFSNENINIKMAENMIVSKNPWYIDQKIMTKCDYLIGPPSTFTIWASYIGKVKYYHIKNAADPIRLENFHYHHY